MNQLLEGGFFFALPTKNCSNQVRFISVVPPSHRRTYRVLPSFFFYSVWFWFLPPTCRSALPPLPALKELLCLIFLFISRTQWIALEIQWPSLSSIVAGKHLPTIANPTLNHRPMKQCVGKWMSMAISIGNLDLGPMVKSRLTNSI